MTKNKIIALIISLFLAISLCACDFSQNTEDNTDPNTNNNNGETRITAPQEVADYIHEYEKLPPNYITKADYIHEYEKLPPNYITKDEAKDLGWKSDEGNLNEVAPGMSIGGDYFGNYDNTLPQGDWHECDVNYTTGYRNAERLVYSDKGDIFYTDDHYKTFTQMY
ncbi:MAG: ribonuclease domain-containing protein [Clostridiales bacterium]